MPTLALSDSELITKVLLIELNATINPATADHVVEGLKVAELENYELVLLELNTPGGLIPSMQSIVSAILESAVPVVVYVSPKGASATSAGMFITLAGHIAAMAPGTTIGAAHPVNAGGGGGIMEKKIENSIASLARSIAETRKRNVDWAEESVTESVSITAREAFSKEVIDMVSSSRKELFAQLSTRELIVAGKPIVLKGLENAKITKYEMSFRNSVANILANPNLAVLLGLLALVGLGLELKSPGAILPGVVGGMSLVLSLIAMQVIPISVGGLLLILLGMVFLILELWIPAFGGWGIAGVICIGLGGIYAVDRSVIFGLGAYKVSMPLFIVFGISGLLIFSLLGAWIYKLMSRPNMTGIESLIGQKGVVRKEFIERRGELRGKIYVDGGLWNAVLKGESAEKLKIDSEVVVSGFEGLTLFVESDLC